MIISMKKLFTGLTATGLAVCLMAGCAGTSNKTQSENDAKKYKIGITQIADHPSLDNCREGFIEGLKELGFEEGKNIEIDFQSAQNDMNVANQIAQNFANTGKDIVCGIATPSAQTLYNACFEKNIPVIFNAVSDPVAAKLAKSREETMPGITGVSDELPVEEQLKLIREILPDAKKIGILYTTSEANSVSTLKTYKELAGDYGFEIVDKGIGTQAEVAQAADVLIKDVDCISNMTDNTVVAALSVVLEKANAAKIPVFGSEEEQVANGCIASAGLDYFNLGMQAGRLAAKVLGGTDISELSYETMEESKITVNTTVAEELSINIPTSVLERSETK